MRKASFAVADLRLVKRAGPPDTFAVGDKARLNSGGPVGLVVDFQADEVTVAWRHQGKIYESILPRVCLTKCNLP